MAFEQLTNRVATTIGRIKIELVDDGQGNKSGEFHLIVYDQEGKPLKAYSGDLAPHLTAQQQTNVNTFLNDLRTLAEAEIL